MTIKIPFLSILEGNVWFKAVIWQLDIKSKVKSQISKESGRSVSGRFSNCPQRSDCPSVELNELRACGFWSIMQELNGSRTERNKMIRRSNLRMKTSQSDCNRFSRFFACSDVVGQLFEKVGVIWCLVVKRYDFGLLVVSVPFHDPYYISSIKTGAVCLL